MIDEPVFEREEFTLKREGVIKVQMMFGIERAEEFGFGLWCKEWGVETEAH